MKKLIVALLPLWLCGCLEVDDHLTIEPDGSGTIKLEVRSGVSSETFNMFGMGESGADSIYPPVTETEARRFFPAKDFTVNVEQNKTAGGGTVLQIEAAFKDINALLASPYGKGHSLALEIQDGALTLQAKAGLEAAARLAGMKTDGMMGAALAGAGLDAAKNADKMKIAFTVTLPGSVASGNGEKDGKTIRWLMERAEAGDADEYAARLATILEASCRADDLGFTPRTPPRLDLHPFDQLQAGAAAAESGTPDAEKIAESVKFVPYALSITRTLDLSGEGGSRQNQAQLIGAIVLPRELAPNRWGEAKLEEVTDSRGRSLKPDADSDSRFGRYSRYGYFSDDEEDDDEEAVEKSAEQRRVITLAFLPPDWKVNEIARIKASVGMQYYGAAQVVKLANAIPAGWIVDMSKMRNFGGLTERSLKAPQLAELDLEINVQMAMTQEGFTMLMLETEGETAAITGAQVFDAEGKPWPTMLQKESFSGDGGCQIVVAGQPKAPLSLAFLVSDTGASIDLPILLENVPVSKSE